MVRAGKFPGTRLVARFYDQIEVIWLEKFVALILNPLPPAMTVHRQNMIARWTFIQMTWSMMQMLACGIPNQAFLGTHRAGIVASVWWDENSIVAWKR
jgi:hypothetical protein